MSHFLMEGDRHPGGIWQTTQMDSWSLFVDIEGFSDIYARDEGKALGLLAYLADGVHAIGSRAFPAQKHRLFAYGIGDGFLISPDLEPPQVQRPLAIAIVLMQHVLNRGGVATASISHGEIADVSGVFSAEVQGGVMGAGFIDTTQVMGTALVNAYGLGKRVTGACLLLEPRLALDLPAEVSVSESAPLLIDWLHCAWASVSDVADRAGLELLSVGEAEQKLRDYIEANSAMLSQQWIRRTLAGVRLG